MKKKFSMGGFNELVVQRDGAQELSASHYNLIIGTALAWGFFLNYLLARFAGPALLRMVYSASDDYALYLIGALVAYLALVFIGNRMLCSQSRLTCFIGYNLIAVPVGLVATIATLGYDPMLVTRAALMTAIVTLSMMIASTLFPAWFARMGTGLAVALIAVVIVELASLLIFRTDFMILDFAVVAIMCLYIGFDWVRANSVQRTAQNALAVSASLYLDIINLFLRILSILSRISDKN